MTTRPTRRLIFLALLLCAPLLAQGQGVVAYTDNFQSYGTQKNPPGWVDHSISGSSANGLYKTWPDPTQSNSGTNIVYGTRQSSGKAEGSKPKIGTFSTYVSKDFKAAGRFEYSGRFIRTNADSRIGLTFFAKVGSSQSHDDARAAGGPAAEDDGGDGDDSTCGDNSHGDDAHGISAQDNDNHPCALEAYYLIGLWKEPADQTLTMQLFPSGSWTLGGTTNSGFTPDKNKWYRFLIQVDDADGATKIRARFWLEGSAEPSTFSINASDATASRRKSGHIGIWAAVKGDSYIDDINVKSPVDHTPPTIEFVNLDTNTVLNPAVRALFKTPARIQIRVTDDLSTYTLDAKLDNAPFTSGTPINADGPHRITVVATDAVGNHAEGALDLLIDQHAPVIALFGNGAALVEDAVFAQDVTLTATVIDLTPAPALAKLGTNDITLPWPVAEEAHHTFTVSATDQLQSTSSVTRHFYVDKSPPVITVLANGEPLGEGASFREDVTLTWSATDLTLGSVTAQLNGTTVQSPLPITGERAHELVITATDRAGHTSTETRHFVFDKTKPEVTLSGNSVAFEGGEFYKTPVTFTLDIFDTTTWSKVVTIDHAAYTAGTAYGTEGHHEILVVVTNAAGLQTTIGPLPFTVDLTPPSVALTENGLPFTGGMKFKRDVNPVVTATDSITAAPVRTLFLDGIEYGLGTPITAEDADHVIRATARDEAGNTSEVGPFHFILDKSKPVVSIVEAASGAPFAANALFARAVSFRVTVADLTHTTVAATLNGAAFSLGTPSAQPDGSALYTPPAVTTDGAFALSIVATDELGWQNDPAAAQFTIDTTAPALAFTSHTNEQVVSAPVVVTAGRSDDAVTMTVNAAEAVIDAAAKTFSSAQLQLVEGPNVITAIGKDLAGNTGRATLTLILDTRAPQLAITAPAAGACLDTQSLEVHGTASDDRLNAVTVTVGDTPVTATISGNSWSATMPVTEGTFLISVRATDSLGHEETVTRTVTIDRTAPVVEIVESGAPFTATLLNRPVALLVRSDAAVTATLDGHPYASGTAIAAEGTHTLAVEARDCAGHVTTQSLTFALDFTPPAIRNLAPANGATTGTLPSAISGATDTDAMRVEIAALGLSATPAPDGTFQLNVPFAEGNNRFTLRATDRAGNSAEVAYSAIVRTSGPVVEILEDGAPVAANALFARAITPVLRANPPAATLTATLNGASFTPGSTIANDGAYTLTARATDELQHTGEATATFTIDKTAPVVTIAAPANNAIFDTDTIEVRGNAGDSVSATVNGVAVTLAANGDFSIPAYALELGENVIVAIGRDRAGNAGRADVTATRRSSGPGIVLTYPPDASTTNRPTTEVLGRVLTPSSVKTLTIGTQAVAVDPTGSFRLNGYPLVEGPNAIAAIATANDGAKVTATVNVTADFTPPSLTILESSQALADGARFTDRAAISVAADDHGRPVSTESSIDGTATTGATTTITAAGGHIVSAVARDLAGNETRAERTFFIGATGTSSGRCTMSGFDPADGAVVLASSATLVGRFVNGVGIRVNDHDATVLDGSFLATVELPLEGANQVRLVCTDAAGAPSGDPVTLTLHRVTGQLSITIDTPAEGFVTASDTITVTGTAGPGVTTADVNGQQAIISGTDAGVTRNYTVTRLHMASGLNVLVARGRDGAGRVATASRRGSYLKTLPAISIGTPAAGTITGASTINVAGTYSWVDPATIAVANTTAGGAPVDAITRIWSDTTGAYHADVPLVPGKQTLRVSGRDSAGRETFATVEVTRDAASPSIAIAAPLDHAYFGVQDGDTFRVTGSFSAAGGARVEVNGVAATITGTAYEAAAVPFLALAGGVTPVVARVTDPDGKSAFATIVVTKLTAAPKALEAFPADNATEVDPGALALVLFSAPMDRTTLAAAFRLEEIGGSAITGVLNLDKDVLTFAPAALLERGKSYRIVVGTAAKDLAGAALAAEFTSTFTVATSASAAAPAVDPIGGAICGESLEVTGTASPGARVRLEAAGITIPAVADAAGRFHFTLPVSGQSGYLLLRVRTVAADGSVSPAAEIQARIDCSGPRVVAASFDRNTNALTVYFSEPPLASTVTSASILLTHSDGHRVTAALATSANVVTITPAEDLKQASFTLGVTTAITDAIGNRLVAPYAQAFDVTANEPEPGDGSGFLSGEVYDATTGRPLASVSISVDVAGTPFTTSSDARGRYLLHLPEGAHTIAASRTGYTTVWRQILVPAGAGVVPIDIRLTKRGDAKTSTGAALTLTHGGDTAITRAIDLAIPAGALTTGKSVTATAVGAQALTGLLPVGWSPLASAEIAIDGTLSNETLSGATLTFTLPADALTASALNLTAVRYDAVRDEWVVLAAAVNVAPAGTVSIPIATAGAYALVYGDRAPLPVPPLATNGSALRGVDLSSTGTVPALVKHAFTLDPPVVLPSGRAVARLEVEGAAGASYPSGTAVQAYIDEELHLADGSRLLDPPFATDLLLYRTPAGSLGVADFHLSPSPRAAEVILEIGFDHIRILPYAGRLDRGTLIGAEGGRVPGDDRVSIEIPAGSAPEPLRATAASLAQADLDAIGAVQGFRVLGGVRFTMNRAVEPAPRDLDGDGVNDAIPPLELFAPARATFSVNATGLTANSQLVLAELLDDTPYGKLVRLAARMTPVDGNRFTTQAIDRSQLPLDGIVREGRYVLLVAERPIALATGTLRLGEGGRFLDKARVSPNDLGVTDLTRGDGIYSVPVLSAPEAPFRLVPRHVSTGDGATYTHPSAPAANAVIRVDLVLAPQPPALVAVNVLDATNNNAALSGATLATNISLATTVRVTFDRNLDASSSNASTITVSNANGANASGATTFDGAHGLTWTLTAGARLQPKTTYTVRIAPVRGTNGSSGTGGTYAFETVAELRNAEVHAERIRITIPDANGKSRVIGTAGALPTGWQAVAIRRGVDFIERYQATAAADGSFSFDLGQGAPRDRIAITDLIDLQAINTAGNIAAIIPLTPFVSEDGRAFVARPDAPSHFVSVDGIALDVEEGTFDVPTLVTLAREEKSAFAAVPHLDDEVNFVSAVRLQFEGTAHKRMQLSVPVPDGTSAAGRNFILAERGQSTRGPRLFAIDTVRLDGSTLTTAPAAASALRLAASSIGDIRTNATLTGDQIKKYLYGLTHSGIFMFLDIRVPSAGSVGWAVMDAFQTSYELFWSTLASFYVPDIYMTERGGRVIIPIITGKPFTVVGVDASTGLTAFTKAYNPIVIGDPGAAVIIDNPQKNASGPYPVFGTPFRVEIVDLSAADTDIESVRNFKLRLEHDRVELTAGEEPLDRDVAVQMLDVTNGRFVAGTAGSALTLEAKLGDRIVLLVAEENIDPSTSLSVVFSEAIYVQGDTADQIDHFLHDQFVLERAAIPAEGQSPRFTDITDQARFEVDSGGRRITITLSSSLARDSIYRLTLKQSLADRAGTVDAPQAGLKLGQSTEEHNGERTVIGGGNDLVLEMRVRKPGGTIASFDIRQSENASFGMVRDLALNGNLLFVTALDGGVLAYDTADPASLDGADGTQPLPIALVRGRESDDSGSVDYWGIATDPHGRVYVTGQTAATGFLRSYRIEDFLKAGQSAQSECSQIPHVVCKAKSSALISWRLGYSSSLGITSETFLSDRPESIPRKVQLLLQDDEQSYDGLEAFKSATGATEARSFPSGVKELKVTLARDPNNQYLVQRITVENETLDMRWSADATPASPASIENIIARAGDRIRVKRNRTTYGVVSHYGFGIGVYDLNAIESNDYTPLPANWTAMREQIALTAAANDKTCFVPYTSVPAPPSYAIQDLSLSAEAAIRGDSETGDIRIYAPDARQGLLDVKITPPTEGHLLPEDDAQCRLRSPEGLIFVAPFAPEGVERRIRALHDAFVAAAQREPSARSNSVANYSWRIEAQDNAKGVRLSDKNHEATRDYVLVAAGDYGVIVVEVGGTPPSNPMFGYDPLRGVHLVDVIHISTGAVAVRSVPRSDLAVVVDREGRVLLLDLTHLDERVDRNGNALPPDQLFPSAKKALAGKPTSPGAVGADDPRVVWRSEPGVVNGTLAPVFDPETGMLYAGQLQKQKINVVAAVDPTIRMKVDLGDESGLAEVSGIVPLGIEPPQSIKDHIKALPPCNGTNARCKENASLGVFRLEVTLPGAIAEALTKSNHELQVAVESERVFDAPTEQTPEGFPRAHLRRLLRDGSQEKASRAASKFRLERIVPDDPELKQKLRHQRGFNKFVSPWVIALADPRASAQYDWGGADAEKKEKAGCKFCERPRYLDDATEDQGVYELWTNGHLLAVRPELIDQESKKNIFLGTKYAWLGEENRFVTRFATITADTVRPTEVLVAAQNAPGAQGSLQETLYVHSGEVESANIDLDAGGRAGAHVVIDRTYRSRSLGAGFLGQGWSSSVFQRLRALPDGNVEYRDADGEVWLFEQKAGEREYTSPKGFFLKLVRAAQGGWTLQDQQWRITTFDELGRVVSQSDEFVSYEASQVAAGTANGNTIRYLYDRQGHLAQILDSVNRATKLEYWKDEDAAKPGAYPGLLKEIKDWRDRTVQYEYDAKARLVRVKLPEVSAAGGAPAELTFTGANRPRIEYEYDEVQAPAAATPGVDPLFKPYLERSGNLTAIKDPDEVAHTQKARVSFKYGSTGNDRLIEQTWATGEKATIQYSGTTTKVTDVLGAEWNYDYSATDDPKKRSQVRTLTVNAPAYTNDDDQASPLSVTASAADLKTTFTYDDEGQRQQVTYPSSLVQKYNYEKASGGAPGMVLVSIVSSGKGLKNDSVQLVYDNEHPNAAATPVEIGRVRDGDPLEKRDAQVPSRERSEVVTNDENLKRTTKYKTDGQVEKVEIGDGASTARGTTIDYVPDDDSNLIARANPASVHADKETSTWKYAKSSNGGFKATETNERGTVTETEYDSYDREIHSTVKGYDGQLLSDLTTGYDATGRAVYSSHQQKGLGTVVSRARFDAMDRELESSLTGAAVHDSPATLVATTKYELAQHKITRTDPSTGGGGASEVTELDVLGRPVTVTRIGGSDALTQSYAYDADGNLVWNGDGAVSSKTINDALGRPTLVISSDGLRTAYDYNAWGATKHEDRLAADGSSLGRQRYRYTFGGRLLAVNESISDTTFRQTFYGVLEGGAKQSVTIAQADDLDTRERATRDIRGKISILDAAGRTKETRAGTPSSDGDIQDGGAFAKTRIAYIGFDPATVFREEPQTGAISTTATVFDGLHRPVEVIESGGTDSSRSEYDEAGNVTLYKPAGSPAETMTYDSRGLMKSHTLADGKQQHFVYDALGNLTERRDESGETTKYVTDGLGRVIRTDYPDQTTEEIRYEPGSGRLQATKDRSGHWLAYKYDTGGRVVSVHSGTDETGPATLKYEYDKGGRLTKVRNRDAAIEYADFDNLGRAATTRTRRFANGSGLSDSATLLDVHTQHHDYTVHDERERWTMPAAGEAASALGGDAWLATILERRDSGANLVTQITPGGNILTSSNGRAVGKLSQRQRPTTDATLETKYGYFDGVTDTAGIDLPGGGGNQKSFLPRFAVSAIGGTKIGGSAVARDASDRITASRHLGLGDRGASYRYDTRGRLELSFLDMAGAAASATPTVDTLVDSDFRSRRETASSFSAQQRAALGEAARSIEPPSWTASRLPGQQIGTRTIATVPPVALPYQFTGGQRTFDGVWHSSYDESGHLTEIHSADRRLEYAWDPNDRLVGRRALRLQDTQWVPEDRPSVLAADGIPAETTFVWDPVTDRLVSIFTQGASLTASAGPRAGLLRQYLHGDQGYDDPVRVLVADGANVRTYLPLIDEAGTGSLEAVVDAAGHLVERVLYADSYGDAPRYLQGPVVDRIAVDTNGPGAGVKVHVHFSELLDGTTVAAAMRLNILSASEQVLGQSPSAPALLDDGYTVEWNLAQSQWDALRTIPDAASLEIAVGRALRATRWGDVPPTSAPSWATDLYGVRSNADYPVIKREALAALNAFLESAEAGQSKLLYNVPSLYAGASTESKTALLFNFKAAPFVEPATGLAYFRERWYDPSTGTWLTPDEAGYGAGSSNLYAAFVNDPVNHHDPDGRNPVIGALVGTIAGSGYAIYREIRYGERFFGANGTWRYIAQGAAAGALIGTGIGAPEGLSLLGVAGYGAASGAGIGGAVSSVTSEGSWSGFFGGTVKGGVLGAVSGGTGFGLEAAGATGWTAFFGSVAADTYAGVAIDSAFGDCADLQSCVATNALGSTLGNGLTYGGKALFGRRGSTHTPVPEFEGPASTGSEGVYDPRSMEALLQSRYPGQVTSTTLPRLGDKNVRLAGQRHAGTSVVFDERGYVVLDDLALFDTRIPQAKARVKSSSGHMRAATRELRAAIQRGEVDASLFSARQLRDIAGGEAHIHNLTWHHHQDFSRMQLVPANIHRLTGHIGGLEMWFR
jgi:RHS repeat-associated protein